MRTAGGQDGVSGKPKLPHKRTFLFLMASGLWNFLGAGVLGSLIDLLIVSHYEIGTI